MNSDELIVLLKIKKDAAKIKVVFFAKTPPKK